jgi:hypothetical protein
VHPMLSRSCASYVACFIHLFIASPVIAQLWLNFDTFYVHGYYFSNIDLWDATRYLIEGKYNICAIFSM